MIFLIALLEVLFGFSSDKKVEAFQKHIIFWRIKSSTKIYF